MRAHRIKHWAAQLMGPALRLADAPAQGCQRLWAYARLRAALGDIPASTVVEGFPELHGTRQIRLGEHLYLYPGQYWETREQGSITLEERVVLSRGVHLAARASIHIGAGSMVGEYSSIRDANHGTGAACLRDAPHHARPIHIGREVWIGRGVTILPGVHIGDHAVIGANAVVTHDIPSGCIAAGVPAKIIRHAAPGETP